MELIEKTLLSQIIQNNNILFDLKIDACHFSHGINKKIFEKIRELLNKKIAVDINVLSSELKDVSGVYISELGHLAVTSHNYKFFEDKLIVKYKETQLKKLKLKISDWLEKFSPDEIFNKILVEISEILCGEKTEIQKVGDLLMPWVLKVEERYKNRGVLPGISTGLQKLDNILLGFEKRKLYYIGGRPSSGKTTLLLNMAVHASLREKKKVGFISMESGCSELLDRIVSAESHIDAQALRSGYFKAVQMKDMQTTLSELMDINLFLYDKPNLKLVEVETQLRKMVIQNKIDIVFIDYLQLIKSDGDNKKDKIANASMALKDMAREFEIPVVCTARLRRDADNKEPTLADFSESGQIEYDADGGILIHHIEDDNSIKSFFIIKKNRDGATGKINVVFNKKYVKFID